MIKITQILIVLLIIIKFESRTCYEISDLQNDEKINANFKNSQMKVETSPLESTTTISKVKEISEINLTLPNEKTTPKAIFNSSQNEVTVWKEESVFNKSIEYLIEEEPNNSNSSHNQKVIIKPLNEFSLHSENEQKLPTNVTDMGKRSNVSIAEDLADQLRNRQIENSVQTVNIDHTESQKEGVTSPVYERKEELIINLLILSHNKVTTSILKESIIFSNKSDEMPTRAESQITTDPIKEPKQISTKTSIKIRINALKQILKFLAKESALHASDNEPEISLKPKTSETQSMENLNKDSNTPMHEKNEEFMFKSINLIAINSTNDHELLTAPENFQNHSTECQKNELPLKSEDFSNQLAATNADDLAITRSEEEESTPKPFITLEDYAVKQMNFILDHMLLESQEFVSKVLQATGSTTFQRDNLKRYAENINRLLNPQLESDYSDDISDSKPVIKSDLYEEVVKKINFFKSKATKELQKHLPADWIKDYKDTKEELKIWLNKASNDMHWEFNLHISEVEDHIKYLYFNEAFDDIVRATEIHQKLALLADLIKIVKNKKQITFMDLYMQ